TAIAKRKPKPKQPSRKPRKAGTRTPADGMELSTARMQSIIFDRACMMVAEMTSHTLSKFKRYIIDELLDEAPAEANKPKPKPPDTGADSRTEAEHLRVRVEELQAQVRQRDITIEGLRREIAELQKTNGDPTSLSAFDAAIKPYEDLVETQRGIIADKDAKIA